MSGSDQWSDLAVRMGSGAAMLVIGLGAVAAGGDVFHAFVALLCGAMVWELVRMLAPDTPKLALQLGGLAGCTSMIAIYVPVALVLPLLVLPAIAGQFSLARYRKTYAVFVLLVMFAGYEMMLVRDDFGFVWLLWLAMVVVATDVAGYFAGRLLGGPQFWPAISPKKTWSGSIAGWVAAAAVSFGFAQYMGVGAVLIVIGIATSFASQMGDIAESSVKRKVAVKDSSALIPGHGGVLDRFDGMLGASVFLLILAQLIGFPPEPL